MPQITYSIVADGGTDRALRPIIDWLIHDVDPTVDILEPDFVKRRGSVSDFLANYETGNQLVFMHRDGENKSVADRMGEFDGVAVLDRVVPVIPIRMTEAWLLTDPSAIAAASGNAGACVDLPKPSRLEKLVDPKGLLEGLLADASSLSGRRLRSFRSSIIERRIDVATRTASFAELFKLPSFVAFRDALVTAYPYEVPN